jgi:ABC-2 type transport system permease protein
MNKISLIIGREYLTRVRKKSFIIMTLIGPVLFASLIVLPGWLATVEDTSVLQIAVVEAGPDGQPVPSSEQKFRNVLPDRPNMKFIYLDNSVLTDILKAFNATQYDVVLYLPQSIMSAGNYAQVELYYKKPTSVGLESYITQSLEKFLFNNKLAIKQIPPEVIQSLETKVSLSRINWKNWPNKEEDTTDMKRGVGYVSGFLIYMFIFMFGTQVMRGILEEKTSRVVEVIISSVSPFQLMMGKIVGIALIGLTQFVAWLLLTYGITFTTKTLMTPDQQPKTTISAPAEMMNQATPDAATMQSQAAPSGSPLFSMMDVIFKQLGQMNLPLILISFLFYFICGYLLYASLFAAIGAAVDNETDTQQFMLPISIPLILGLFVMINSFLNPSGKLAVIFSMIPLTSPIVMMARIPFGVPPVQLLASAVLLVITFLGTTWLAAKIYRTGILMYGKKASYGELWKWIKY